VDEFMQIIHRRASDYVTTPWKNGGGRTTQVAIDPPEMTLSEPFLWRVSRAEVKASGPFSQFPGYERHIIQLAGGRMRLDHGVHGAKDLAIETPYVFSGDWPTYGSLDDGSARDFNLMLRREYARGRTTICRMKPDESLAKPLAAHVSIIVVLGGSLLATSTQSIRLLAEDCLILKRRPTESERDGESANTRTIELSAMDVVTFVWIEIDLISE